MTAYKQISYSPLTLESLGCILIEFNRATIISLGDIVLLVKVRPIVLNVKFSIVEDLSPYNAIVGCACIHKMKAIMSTYHQMVSYLTSQGQIYLHRSQLVTR